MTKYLLWWAAIWVIISIIVLMFSGEAGTETLLGVAVAAIISLIFLVKILTDQWEGEIIEVKKVSVYVSDDDGGRNEEKLVAIVQLPNGKKKKIDAINGYEVGNYIIKKKGETTPRVFDKKP